MANTVIHEFVFYLVTLLFPCGPLPLPLPGADPGKNVTGFQKGEHRRRELARGVRGHAPPENFENFAL